MSGIFGIFNRNGKPIDREIVNVVLDASSSWNPDDRGTWINGSVALGHTMLWNTPESKHEHLPNTQDHLSITMDARLDNREELAEKLSLKHRPLQQITDSDFILAAYHKWGEECPRYLLGDFVFAIWDEIKQRLFCARDHVGIKPFFYYLTDECFVFGNDMRAFLAHPHIDKKINEDNIAYYLRGEDCLQNLTFYEHIHKLLPATSMAVNHRAVSKRRYWLPEKSPRVRFSSDEAYAARLRELLKQAVQARLRSAYPVTSHLSGGLDSSGIAVIASRLLREVNRKLLTFNWVAKPEANDDPEYYEWGYSKRLADREEIEHHHVALDAESLSDIFLNLDITHGDTVDLWYEFFVREQVANANSRVILSGWGGDEIVTSYGRGYFSELLYRGRVVKSIRALKAFTNQRNYTVKEFLKLYLNVAILQSLPLGLRCLLHKKSCHTSQPLFCINKNFADFVESIKGKGFNTRAKSVRDVQLSYLNGGHIQERTESWAIASSTDKIEYRYPLLDKRLVEFSLGIPSDQFIKNSTTRYIYREAMKGMLPDEIRLNHEKDEPKRVRFFHELCTQALKIGINNNLVKTSKYIDSCCLHSTIHDPGLIEMQRDERASRLDALMRAFFVLKFSTSLKKMNHRQMSKVKKVIQKPYNTPKLFELSFSQTKSGKPFNKETGLGHSPRGPKS